MVHPWTRHCVVVCACRPLPCQCFRLFMRPSQVSQGLQQSPQQQQHMQVGQGWTFYVVFWSGSAALFMRTFLSHDCKCRAHACQGRVHVRVHSRVHLRVLCMCRCNHNSCTIHCPCAPDVFSGDASGRRCALSVDDRDAFFSIREGVKCQCRQERNWGGARATLGAFGGRVYYEVNCGPEAIEGQERHWPATAFRAHLGVECAIR
jgi:hypothetical protein